MAFPVELLTDQALCDAALADLDSEISDLTYRQTTHAHHDDKYASWAEDMTQEIATLDSDIARYNADIPTMTEGSKSRLRREAELRAAVKRRGDLGAALLSRGPVQAFRTAVDLQQVTQSLAVLNNARQEVTTHRATVPA